MSGDEIQVERRRKGARPVGRAEAPRREREGVPSGAGPSRPVWGGGLPSRGVQLGGCGTLLLILLFIAYYLLTGGPGPELGGVVPGEEQVEVTVPSFQPVQPPQPASNFTPPPTAASGRQTWTVMLYQDADDQVLEQDIYLDLNEAERVGSSPNVHIVAQIDRFRAGYQGDGNWVSARRYYVTQDTDLSRVGSKLVQELGEVDMSSPQSLVDFVQWSVQNFPADRYVLILSDHGMGWPGGWSAPAPGGIKQSRAPLVSRLGNNMYLMELDQALAQARAAAGIDKFEIIGLDACLMGRLEVMAALQPHANYAVASEEVEPAIGWAYADFLGKLVQNPDMSGAELSRAIVESYVVRVFGFLSETDTGAPREITPSPGDTFTIYEKWLDLDANGNVTAVVKEESETLTFGTETFRWVELYAAPGEYVLGFIVEDMDENQYPAYTRITVQ